MAEHKKLWYQGVNVAEYPKCDGKPSFTCPKSRNIAAEYQRGYFTLTNVINPNTMWDNLGSESWLFDELSTVVEGDYLWLVLVPPKHHVNDVFIYNETTFTDGSSCQTFGGITLQLVTGNFTEADADGNCTMSGEATHGNLVMPATPDAKEQFLRDATDITTDTNTWVGVGFKVVKLPKNSNLASFVGKIVVGCHAVNYDGQTYM